MRRLLESAQEGEEMGAVARLAGHLEARSRLEETLQERSKAGVVIGQGDAVGNRHIAFLDDNPGGGNTKMGPIEYGQY